MLFARRGKANAQRGDGRAETGEAPGQPSSWTAVPPQSGSVRNRSSESGCWQKAQLGDGVGATALDLESLRGPDAERGFRVEVTCYLPLEMERPAQDREGHRAGRMLVAGGPTAPVAPRLRRHGRAHWGATGWPGRCAWRLSLGTGAKRRVAPDSASCVRQLSALAAARRPSWKSNPARYGC